ncbi:hypothetical protein C7212DRAFT_289964, partial [Tuber magnatum]
MNSHGSTATQLSEPRNPNRELSNRNRGSIPPFTPSENSRGRAPFLLLEQENITLPSAGNPDATSTCTVSRQNLTTSSEKQPARSPSPPQTPRQNQSDSPPPISFHV